LNESLKFAIRRSQYQGSVMVDICDYNLVGRKLEQDGLVVPLTEEYFMQEVVPSSSAKELLQKCDIANLVGKSIVDLALELKLAKEVSIKYISGVPFLMIFKFQHR
jgi:uncharacterized protein